MFKKTKTKKKLKNINFLCKIVLSKIYSDDRINECTQKKIILEIEHETKIDFLCKLVLKKIRSVNRINGCIQEKM